MLESFENATPARTATEEPKEALLRFAKLQREKKDLKTKLDAIQEEITQLDQHLRETFFDPNGLTSAKTPLGTVSIRTDIRVSSAEGVSRDELAARLKRFKAFGYLVKPNYNSQSLAAAVRERYREAQEKLGDELLELEPDERRTRLVEASVGKRLAELLVIYEQPSLTFTAKR